MEKRENARLLNCGRIRIWVLKAEMVSVEEALVWVYGVLFVFAIYVWFKLTKTMGEFKFKVMQRLFYLMLISNTYVTLWLFAEILLRATGIIKTHVFDAITLLAVGLLLAVYLLVVQTLQEHRQELTKFDSLYYRM